jgi:CBS domain-containing protein
MTVADLIASRKEVFSAPEAATVHEAARYLRDYEVRAVGEDEAGYRGLISAQDLLRVIATDQKARADMLEAYLFPNR